MKVQPKYKASLPAYFKDIYILLGFVKYSME